MGLCDDCKVLEFDEKDYGGYPKENEEGERVLWFDVEPQGQGYRMMKIIHLQYRRDVTLADLESMIGVCEFCSLIRQRLLEKFPTHKRFELRELWYEWEDGRLTCLILGFWITGEYENESFVKQEGSLDCYGEESYALSRTKGHDHISFDIFAEPGSCATWLDIKNMVIPEDILSSERTGSMMKNWLDLHAAEESSTTPTRLIDVCPPEDGIECRLVHTSEGLQHSDPTKYAALSYCWGDGKNPPLKTTKDTIKLWQQKGFLDECMPATYQDAVKTVRKLDIRYLWIDSLCIVQDDIQDWERESVEMSEIYRGAAVTIVPIAAKSCHDGFLKRSPKPTAKVPHSSSLNPRLGGEYFLREHDYNPVSELGFAERASMWITRGWTFQESMFSMKKLYFGKRKMIFESHGMFWSEDTPQSEPIRWRYDSLSRLQGEELEGPNSSFDRHWYGVVREYTRRNLTFEFDRLPAFSSYAKNFATMTGCHYLAGLWREELLRGLLWRLTPIPESKLLEFIQTTAEATNGNSISTRCAQFTAPSWSWARGSGPVEHVNDHAPSRERLPMDPIEPLEPLIIDAGVTVDGLNEFGRVSDGYIRISGKVRRLSEMTPEAGRPYSKVRRQCDAMLEGKLVARCWADWIVPYQDGLWMKEFPKASVEGALMLLLAPIPEYEHIYRNRGLGILLLPAEKAGTYRRVGLFESFDESIFESAEFRDVTII